ncbi:MAG: 50S ribosomal protein L29 [Clostridia bacterium]|nr:50S ribosomal protein L29 [Clostridia bacterium]
MKVKEIRDMTTEELQMSLYDLKKELFNLRFQHATNQLDNPMQIGDVKKTIARTLTVLREREIKGTD